MSQRAISLAVAQINLVVGAIEDNAAQVISIARDLATSGVEIIVFPELTLTAYPPEDLLLRPALYVRVTQAIQQIQQQLADLHLAVIIGYPSKEQDNYYNSLAWIQNGKICYSYNKQMLPNYGVFDEKRYFSTGKTPCHYMQFKGRTLALLICEDIWHKTPIQHAITAGADAVICINASPFASGKLQRRHNQLQQLAQQYTVPILYVNLVGGQDQLVFDGRSCAFSIHATDKTAYCSWQATAMQEEISILQLQHQQFVPPQTYLPPKPINPIGNIYQALVLGLRDYVEKNNFPGAILGLSGGIDSALALCLAVDALGAARISAYMLPTRFTRDMSCQDARQLADNLQVDYHEIAIQSIVDTCQMSLESYTSSITADTSSENIQARTRGMILMALSNKSGKLVIACGNKSEMAVGYATLYGDMAGGFVVLKDIPKTMVYKLATWRNQPQAIIPERIIKRAPSAELSADQVDQDSLPPYSELDDILDRYIEQQQSPQQIIDSGYSADTVKKVVALVNRNEYKRRQAPPGIRISQHAFDRARRYPITSHYFKK